MQIPQYQPEIAGFNLDEAFRLPYLYTQHEHYDQDCRNDSHKTKQELIEAFVEKRMWFLLNGFILIGGLLVFVGLVEIHSLQYTT